MKAATRRLALWLADLDGGVCAAPEECVETLRDQDVTVVLEHNGARHEFTSRLHEDVEWQFGGIIWPDDMPPGVVVTATWRPGTTSVTVRTLVLDEPVRIDGVDYYHDFDPRVVTREFTPGTANRGKVLHAVRRHGRLFDDGSAVLPDTELVRHTGLGRGARGAFLISNAVDQLIREGYLTRVDGSIDSTGYPSYPAVDGQKPAELLFYAPLLEEVPDRAEHWVSSFVRKLPPGAHPSERQRNLHEQITEEPLAPGYTFVKGHRR